MAESAAHSAFLGRFGFILEDQLRDRVGNSYRLRVGKSMELMKANGENKKPGLGYIPIAPDEFETTSYPTLIVGLFPGPHRLAKGC